MGLSYNQAKGLVEKGRKKKDGGSTVLEKFMPIEIVPKRKTDRSRAKERMKQKNEQSKKKKRFKEFDNVLPVGAKNGKVTRIRKEDSMRAKSGQFKNIVNDSVSGKISPEEAQKMVRKLVVSKSDGGTNKVKNMPKKHKLEKYLTKEEIKKIGPMGTELLLKVQEGVMKGRGKKDGGVLKELPSASENPGLRKLPTEVRNKMGYKKKGGTMKMMSGGGVARGTGAAVKGTGFKGVY